MKPQRSMKPFQGEGANFLAGIHRGLLADDPGLGKTIQAISAAVMRRIKSDLKVFRVLVLSPNNVVPNWHREIKIWGCHGISWSVINYDKLVQREYRTVMGEDGRKIEPSKKFKENTLLKDLVKEPWDIVILDEAHEALRSVGGKRRGRNSKRGYFIYSKLLPLSKQFWMLTATPIGNHAYEAYGLAKILKPKFMADYDKLEFQFAFCKSKYNRFAFSKRTFYGFKNKKRLRKLFDGVMLRRKKSEVAKDLPKKTITTIHLEVPPKLMRECTGVDSEKLYRHVYNGKKLPKHIASVIRGVGLAKAKQIADYINSFPADEPYILFCWHRTVAEEIFKRLKTEKGKKAILIGGSKDKARLIRQAQKGKFTRFVCNMKIGGTGTNFQNFSYGGAAEFPYSATIYKQVTERIHRIGSKYPVTFNNFMAKDTTDFLQWKALKDKQRDILKVIG